MLKSDRRVTVESEDGEALGSRIFAFVFVRLRKWWTLTTSPTIILILRAMSSPEQEGVERRKRKRSSPHPFFSDDGARLPPSQDARGVFVDLPLPSSSALAAYHAAHLPSSQLDGDSEISLPASIFHDLNASVSEYVPSTQNDTTDSAFSAAALRPLPTIPASAFEPFLDDTTGMDLDSAEKRLEAREEEEQGGSSPVEDFSQAIQAVVRPEDVPRIGAWVLPPLTEENRNMSLPVYGSQEVMSQLPYVEEEYSDWEEVPVQSTPAFAVPAKIVREEGGESQLQSQPSPPPPVVHPAPPPPLPVESTPALPAPIASLDQAPSSTPALPPAPTQNADLQSSASASSSSSLGWSTLPKAELISLIHRSSYTPSFLKDEIERFITRSHRSSSSTKPSSSYPSRRSQSASQSQSQSQSNNDDSETQEDGFLRTKNLWCMDLLRFPSSSSLLEGLSQEVLKLTQQSESSRGATAVILLLDVKEGTFDVHELEEPLARVLRNDRRYSVLYDCNGRAWKDAPSTPPAVPSAEGTELEKAKAEISSLQAKLLSSSTELDTLSSANTSLKKELTEAQGQHDFLRSLYDRASSSASSAQAALAEAQERITLLETQLSSGLALHSAALNNAVEKWKSRISQLEMQHAFMRSQKELSDAQEIRQKAGLWDKHVAQERERERVEEVRRKEREERFRSMEDYGRGPFAKPILEELEGVEGDGGDELAALAAEAAEAGDSLPFPSAEDPSFVGAGGGRSRRSRRNPANTPSTRAPATAEEREAAEFSSTHALTQSNEELEDQLNSLPAQPGFEVDLSAAPSAGLHIDLYQAEAEAEMGIRGDDGEKEAEGWNESIGSNDVPPGFTSGSLLLNSEGGLVGSSGDVQQGGGEGVNGAVEEGGAEEESSGNSTGALLRGLHTQP